MATFTRKNALAVAAVATAIALIGKASAVAAETDDRPGKLITALEGFRKDIPPAQGLNEQNGLSVKQIEPYLLTHLDGVARRLGVTSRAECLVLLTYLKDPQGKIRYIAIRAIESVVKAYPDGMSIECLTDTGSDEHRRMVLRFVQLIDKLPADPGAPSDPGE